MHAAVATDYDYVVGVDTHSRTHTYAILDSVTGRVLDQVTFPTSPPGLSRALAWMRRRATGRVLVAIEGTGSYGATLARTLHGVGIDVCDVRPPKRDVRAGRGKTDNFDAVLAARNAIASGNKLNAPRADGDRSALRVLLVARQSMDSRRTADRNALNALLRTVDLGVDARHALTNGQIRAIQSWRGRTTDPPALATMRREATRLARSVKDLDERIRLNASELAEHVNALAPAITTLHGVGPVTAAMILVAYSHKGRVKSEAAFAALAGVSPIPASSGNTVRYRLSRQGDRQLNRALDVVARVRCSSHPETRAYVERRLQEGRTRREIRRSLKRYIARQIYRQLNTIMTEAVAA